MKYSKINIGIWQLLALAFITYIVYNLSLLYNKRQTRIFNPLNVVDSGSHNSLTPVDPPTKPEAGSGVDSGDTSHHLGTVGGFFELDFRFGRHGSHSSGPIRWLTQQKKGLPPTSATPLKGTRKSAHVPILGRLR